LGAVFTTASSTFTQYVLGTAGSNGYRLASAPDPTQAYATAQVVNGFVVGATVTSGGAVTKITITDVGIGYTSRPSIIIVPPLANALWPTVSQALALNMSSLSPYQNYQVESAPVIGVAWSDSGIPLTPTSTMSTQ
jgi:hypothetical protein